MDAEQTRLVESHIEFVRALAGQVQRNLPAPADPEELVAFGLKGLAEAASRYDATRGASFKTFAYYRIRGAMFDGLRALGWLSRSDHAKVRAVQRADEVLEESIVAGAPPPAPSEAAAQLEGLLTDVAAVIVTSVDSFERTAADPAQAGGAEHIETVLTNAQTARWVRGALSHLPEKERSLLEKHYYEDKTLEDAGKELGMSKSWASRLHAKAVTRLRQALDSVSEEGDTGVFATVDDRAR